jgi:hypothetical protein
MGWRGRLALESGGRIDAVAWREAANVGQLSAAGAFRIRYRVSRSRRSGRPEVEIVGAAAPQAVPEVAAPPIPGALAATA